ncbi:MAG: hypothetical protein OYH77_06280 [Pseudomonadota bacterium]|nr:hypothetical protein [Pseudomonadota bacterium]
MIGLLRMNVAKGKFIKSGRRTLFMSARCQSSLAVMCLAVFFLAQAYVQTAVANTNITLGEKNILLLRPALNSVWGEYIFSVHNPTDVAQVATIGLLLPHEKTDFRANEGANDADLRLTADGEVVLEREYPAGTTVFSILFKSSASNGEAMLSFATKHDIADLVLMYENGLQVAPQSGEWQQASIPALPHKDYQTWQNAEAIRAGQSFALLVNAVPTDRQRLHLLALGFAVILVMLSVFGVVFRRPADDSYSAENRKGNI